MGGFGIRAVRHMNSVGEGMMSRLVLKGAERYLRGPAWAPQAIQPKAPHASAPP